MTLLRGFARTPNKPHNNTHRKVLLIFASARPVDDEADAKIGKNKEYRVGATRHARDDYVFDRTLFSKKKNNLNSN